MFHAIFIFKYLFIFNLKNEILLFLIIGLLLFIFLNYNNKSYLGDSGVYLIAFITATIIIKMYNNGYLFCDQILLMMLIPGIDLIRLTFIRIYNGRHPFKADNFHIHHILMNNFNEKSFLIIFSLISIPNILAYLFDTFLIFIMISIGLYFYIIKTYNNGIKKLDKIIYLYLFIPLGIVAGPLIPDLIISLLAFYFIIFILIKLFSTLKNIIF